MKIDQNSLKDVRICKNILPHKFSCFHYEYCMNYTQKTKLRQYANELLGENCLDKEKESLLGFKKVNRAITIIFWQETAILWVFSNFRPKAHLHIVVIWFFGYNSPNIHQVCLKICGEVYFHDF